MATQAFREQCGDFQVVGLRDEQFEAAIVPACGAKIIRLRDCRRDREWTWSALATRRLHRNAVGDPFEKSPLVGVDECIPTVAPCLVDGAEWPDHGEAWPRSWDLDEQAFAQGIIATSLQLETAPLRLRRSVRLSEGILRLEYHLQNLATAPQRYTWALHPLLAFRPGDELELPERVGAGRVDSANGLGELTTDSRATWPEPAPGFRLDTLLAGSAGTSLKLYVPSPSPARVAVHNVTDGTRLHMRYGPVELLPFLGIWVTRGGWNGYEHFAVEPTNVNDDRAARIDARDNPTAVLPPREERSWYVELSFADEAR